METSPTSQTVDYQVDDNEVVDLIPTMMLPNGGIDEAPLGAAGVGFQPLNAGSGGSLSGELQTLRRKRLGAAALFMAFSYGILFLWNFLNPTEEHSSLVWMLMGVRTVLAAVVAGIAISRLFLTDSGVHALEFALFGGLTLLLMYGQYHVNMEMLARNHAVGVVAYMKNGVIQMFALMMLYGMFIPNSAKLTSRVVLAMALAPVISYALLIENNEGHSAIEELRAGEQVGSNVLFLLLGASLAIYGAYVLNGLRVELHQARKFGQYQLGKKLGAGGMGEVYLAEHVLLKRPCALKLIKPAVGSDPIALARFEREVQSAAQLSHPNSIEIFDYGHTSDGTFYYVMEFLKGESLGDLIMTNGPLDAGRTIYVMRQVCAGLAEAHGRGLVHRDIKPGNIFVAIRGGEYDVAKVLDFGLVKITNVPEAAELTGDYTVSGTPLFMAPEQATGSKDLDHRADIYALGCVMYYTLTGRPPFEGDAIIQVMISHARDTVVPPSQIVPSIPKDLEAVVLHCLAKKPEDRYADAKSLGKALAGCAAASEWDAEKAESWWQSRPALMC